MDRLHRTNGSTLTAIILLTESVSFGSLGYSLAKNQIIPLNELVNEVFTALWTCVGLVILVGL